MRENGTMAFHDLSKVAVLRAALEHMVEGFSVWSEDLKLLASNSQFERLLDLPKGLAKPGAPFESFVRFNAERGEYGPGDPEEQVRERVELARRELAHHFERTRPDGTVLEVRGTPIPGVGMVSIYTDITRRKQAEISLENSVGNLELRVADRTRELESANARMELEITERARVEEALRLSEERFRDYAETASDWFWESGPDHRFTFFSVQLAALGLDPHVRLGKARWEVATENDQTSEKWEEYKRTLDERRSFRDFVYRAPADDGTDRYLSVSGKPHFGRRGEFLGYRGAGRDITEAVRTTDALRLAKEQAVMANEAKSQFLANMSHELRTPLNAIIGFSELICMGLAGRSSVEKYGEYADNISISGRHLHQIIDDLLDLARIDAGKAELDDRVLLPQEVVEPVVRILAAEVAAANLSLHVEAEPDPPRLRVSERALRQILLNLIGNAIKFTPSGGQIGVLVHHSETDGICFRVTDTGVGIAPEDVDKLMQPFTQLDSRVRRWRQGSGLGLAIVRSLAEAQGGSVTIESEPKKGTTVTVQLPKERIAFDHRGSASSSK